MKQRRRLIVVAASLVIAIAAQADETTVSFHREVAPILKRNCNGCHRPGKTKGGLDLTGFAVIMQGGKHGAIVKSGKPQLSELIEQVIGEDPAMLLHDPATAPALDVLKAIPSTWDETRVLPPSAIGDLSVMARRKGEIWFLSALNGRATARELPNVSLEFLSSGTWQGVLLTSPKPGAFERKEMKRVTAKTALPVALSAGDGFVLMLRKQ